jgi:hypothetical protein
MLEYNPSKYKITIGPIILISMPITKKIGSNILHLCNRFVGQKKN